MSITWGQASTPQAFGANTAFASEHEQRRAQAPPLRSRFRIGWMGMRSCTDITMDPVIYLSQKPTHGPRREGNSRGQRSYFVGR